MCWKWVEMKEDVEVEAPGMKKEDSKFRKGDICETDDIIFLCDSVYLNQFLSFSLVFNRRTDNFHRVSVDSFRPYHGEKKA